ncbi:MAG: hypothetical protein KA324_13655 [Rubrivivax sp.]|nr:hypothetical protein [Rubrivivax sp.]
MAGQIDPDVFRAIYGRDPAPTGVVANPLPALQHVAPEAAAKGLQHQRRTGIDAILAAEHLPQVEQERDQAHWDVLVQRAPKAAQFLTERPAAAAAMRDDMPAITSVADAVGRAVSWMMGAQRDGGLPGFAGRAATTVGAGATFGLSSAAAGMLAAPFGLADQALQVLDNVAAGVTGTPRRQIVGAPGPEGFLLDLGQQAGDTMRRATPDMSNAGNIERGFQSGLQSLGQNLVLLPLALTPGGAPLALGAMAASAGGQSYGQARQAGVGPVGAAVYGASDAAIEFGTEAFAFLPFLRDLKAGAPLVRNLLMTAAREVPGEQAATLLQDLNAWAVLKPDATLGDYLAERPDAAVQTLVATLVGTGGQVTLMHGLQKVLDRAAGVDRQAQFAERQQQALAELATLAEATKVRQRDPETAAEFFQSLTDEQVPALYVDAQVLQQSGVTRDELAAAAGAEAAAQFDAALAAGGDVVIPTGEFLARAPGSAALASLLEHARTAPDAMSAAEGKAWMAERGDALQTEMAQAMQAQQETQALADSRAAVETEFARQLDEAGRFSADVNRRYAALLGSFYSVTAGRLGITAEELAQRYPLRIAAQAAPGAAVLEQPGTPAFQRWFGDSKVVDADGKPLVVYHGTSKAFTRFDGGKTMDGAFWFTSDRGAIDRGEVGASGSGAVMSVYLSAKKLAGWDEYEAKTTDQLIAEGYDGVKLDNDYIVFEPTQIKSATGNRGTYDPADPSILNKDSADGPRGQIAFAQDITQAASVITLFDKADLSTFIHEAGHFFLRAQLDLAARIEAQINAGASVTDAERGIVDDARRVLAWFGVQGTPESEDSRYLTRKVSAAMAANPAAAEALRARNRARIAAENGGWTDELRDQLQAAEEALYATEGGSELDDLARAQDASRDREVVARSALTAWHAMPLEQQRQFDEQWARGFEAYAFEGRAPSLELQELFQRFRSWLLRIYKNLTALNVQLTDEVRGVMDRMLAADEAIQTATTARAMGPLFETAAQAGMTPEQWAGYQALGEGATAQAVDALQVRGLRDLKWLTNARSKRLKEQQRAMATLRREMAMDVRTEVMGQPVYRAWAFLTRKLGAEDKLPDAPPKPDPKALDVTRDSLLVAIAKLGGINRESAQRDLSVADDELKAKVPVFGASSVFRLTGGRSADDMLGTLTELGYMHQLDEFGRAELRELDDLVTAELRGGEEQFSMFFDYDRAAAEEARRRPANPQALDAGRLDLTDLRAMGLPDEVLNALQARKMTAKDGLPPDLVADLFGFTSGDELARVIAQADPPQAVIDRLTDERMIERYGDLATPEGMQRAVDAALHTEARGRMIAAEMDALQAAGRPAGQDGRRSANMLAQAAADYARMVVGRLRLRDIQPARYQAAEARAGRDAIQAMRKGDTTAAAEAKRRQLIQHASAREAIAARAEMDKARAYLRRMAGRPKGVAPDYLDQIEQMLERHDMTQRSDRANDRRASFSAWVQAQLKLGHIPDFSEALMSAQELQRFRADIQALDADGELVFDDDAKIATRLAEGIERSAAVPFRDMTVDQVRALVDAVRQVEHLGRMKRRMLLSRERAEFEAVRDEVVASVRGNGGRPIPPQRRRTRNDAMGRAWQAVVGFAASHIKVSTWARMMDGHADNGPVWRNIIRPANERASWESSQRAEASEALQTILGPVLANVPMRDRAGRGRFFPSIGDSLNWQERFAVALNTGNEGNLQRLLDGNGWTRAQIEPVLQSLSAAEWSAAQQVWDFFERYRPQVGELEKRTTGKEPQWVQPLPQVVQTADGQRLTLRGGYFPIRYDVRQSMRAEQQQTAEDAKALMRAAHNAASTRRNFVKARAEQVKGRPLMLNLQALYGGVNDVIHDLAWREWLMDTGQLLRSDAIQQAVREHYGPEVMGEFRKWTEDIAVGSRRLDHVIERFVGFLRRNISMASMGYSLMTAAMQFTGLANSMARVGARAVALKLAAYAGSPKRMTREAMAASEFMRNRTRTRFRELNELRNTVEGETTARAVMGRYAYWLMMRAQLMVDVPTWWAAHDQALADGQDADTAVALADQAVKDAQGGGEEVDQAGVERNANPVIQAFTAFSSYMISTLNTAVLAGTAPQAHAKKAANLLLVLVVPAVLTAVMKSALIPGGEDEEPEDLAKRLAAEQLSFLFGLFIGVREFSFLGKQALGEHAFPYTGPAGLRMIPDVQKLGTQAMQGEFDAAFAKSFVSVLGDLTGLPAVQINRTITGVVAIEEGEVDGPADSFRALAFGFERGR